MAARRIIGCVCVKDGKLVVPARVTLSREMLGPVEAAEALEKGGADEVYLLDASATVEGRVISAGLIETVTQRVSVPLVAGGGVRNVDDIREILEAGAAKVAVNSAGAANSELFSQAAAEFGSERVVVAIDAKNEGAGWTIHTHGGTRNTHIDAITWAQEIEAQGASEVLLTSLDRNATGSGFDVDLAHAVADEVEIPVLAAGGAGSLEHFAALLRGEKPAGAVAASVFLSGKLTARQVKDYLRAHGIAVAADRR